MDIKNQKPTDASLRNQAAFLKWGRLGIYDAIKKYNEDTRNYISDFLTYHGLNDEKHLVMDTENENQLCYLHITDDNVLEIIHVDGNGHLTTHIYVGTYRYGGDDFAEASQMLLNTFKPQPEK